MANGQNQIGEEDANDVIDAAGTHLCPGAIPPPGPMTTFTEGVFVVGEDIAPGRYKATGGTSCYWKRSTGDGSDIIDNHLGSGPAVATVKARMFGAVRLS